MTRLLSVNAFLLIVSIAGQIASADEASGLIATGADASATCCDACVKAAGAENNIETKAAPALADLETINPLRERFNADHGAPRAIALLSPVCPGCIKSAELIRSAMLEKYKDADLKLYIVWLPMVPGDARDRWNPDILKDTRAVHHWNGSRSIGKWFAKNVTECEPLGQVAWDVVYLFGRDAKWNGDDLNAEFCPTPVYKYPDELSAAAQRLLGDQPHSGG